MRKKVEQNLSTTLRNLVSENRSKKTVAERSCKRDGGPVMGSVCRKRKVGQQGKPTIRREAAGGGMQSSGYWMK